VSGVSRLLDRRAAAGGSGDATTPPTSGASARIAAWVAVGAAAAALVLSTFGAGWLADGSAGEVVVGRLEVELAVTGEVRQLTVGDRVPAEAQLRANGGSATVRVPTAELSLAPGTIVDTTDGGALILRRGSVLVRGPGPVQLVSGAVDVLGRGTWRVDVGPASRLATYRGRVQAADGVSSRQLARYEQVDLRGGALDGDAAPLRYRDDDVWDRDELAEAMAVDRLAGQLTTSLTATHGTALRPPSFYTRFVGADAPVLARLDDLAPRRRTNEVGPPAPVLLGMTVADALVVEGGFLPAPAVSRVVDLRRGGASWGLVLVVHDLGAPALRAAASRALDRAADTPAAVGAGAATGEGGIDANEAETGARAADSGPGAGAGDPAPGTDAAGGASPTSPSPSPSPSPGPSPSPSPSPSPGSDPSPSPTPAPSPTPDDEPRLLEDLLPDPDGSIGELLDDTTRLLSGPGVSGAGLMP
jgi:hypothetical protein